MQAGVPDRYPTQQLHLGLFSPHEINVWEQEQERIRLRKEHLSLNRPPRRFWIKIDLATCSLFDSMDVALLDSPLGGPNEGNELNCVVDPLLETVEEQETLTNSRESESDGSWSDDAVAQLHEAVLHHSLKALQAKGNGVEKREILQWIFAPQPMVATLAGDAGHCDEAVLPQHLTPFSFERCCRVCGFSHERLKDGLMPILSVMGLGNILSEIPNGTN